MAKKERQAPEISAGAMADIAFLLLIFFLVTTQFPAEEGIPMVLPPKKDPNQEQLQKEINDRNLFKILVNRNDELLVEDEIMDLANLKEAVKRHITNNGRDPKLSDSPQKAVVSIKVDRGTSYDMYIKVLDRVKQAYHEARAEALGITVEQYLAIKEDKLPPDMKQKYQQVKERIPMMISIADPNKKK
ncbi:biopolymer transport protein ExbD [Thermonema lapsum]|jgi:biopolymer transport protein ExbD|uniref:Biopolymer transport protein ExbD n=1 Tax=Thermonema lapsum TaxID=28195 RepID=A0A846MQI4_9BACT|nr:biopolymer transporter ExbD [Thermonema lapsum]NIK73844.1 biopolymer transport protein ExbD [Thermonema lapsum]